MRYSLLITFARIENHYDIMRSQWFGRLPNMPNLWFWDAVSGIWGFDHVDPDNSFQGNSLRALTTASESNFHPWLSFDEEQEHFRCSSMTHLALQTPAWGVSTLEMSSEWRDQHRRPSLSRPVVSDTAGTWKKFATEMPLKERFHQFAALLSDSLGC